MGFDGIGKGNLIDSLRQSSNEIQKSFNKLSSGKRINSASDDPAGLAIAEQLAASASTGQVAQRNIQDGYSQTEIASSALSTISDIEGRKAELATQAANGTLSDSQRSALDQEYQSLSQEQTRIVETTQFNGVQLLSANGSSTTIQVDNGQQGATLTLSLPGVGGGSPGSIATQASAQAAIDTISTSIQSLSDAQGTIGALQSRLQSAGDNVAIRNENQLAAASRIRDVDVAEEVANLTRNNILQQSSTALLAQANQSSASVLRLLQ